MTRLALLASVATLAACAGAPLPDPSPVRFDGAQVASWPGADERWQEFAALYPEQGDAPAATVELDDAAWRRIIAVNRAVNRWPARADAVGDDRWRVADLRSGGDCEDLALAKRQLLADAGLPLGALHLAVGVRGDEGHATLMVATDRGDLLLDNLTDEVVQWHGSSSYVVGRRDDGAWTIRKGW